jgi:hypothetical protein
MSTCSFDQLLYALRTAVEAANDALRLQRDQQFSAGDASGQGLHVYVPADAHANAALESVVIPLRWFRDHRVPQVTEFSMEFECRLHYRHTRGARAELIVDLSRPRVPWWRRAPVHRMRIALHAADAWQPSVAINGRVVPFPTAAGVR